MSQVQRAAPVHDVVIIGSGAGGGTAAHVLANLGVKVLLLEAGPNINPGRDYKEHKTPAEYPHRGAGEGGESYFPPSKTFGFFNAPNGYWEIGAEPYTSAPGTDFRWFRSRIVGGRTNHYGRITLRFADYDFKVNSMDGLGADWPISYDDVAPYYDKVERFIGVCGSKEGLRTAPDGIFLPPPAPRVNEILTRKSCEKLGIPCIPSRMSIITKAHNGRPACHYCGQCGRGCVTASNYSSSQVQIFPALKTGNLTMVTGAMVRELVTGPDGKVTAVSYIDKQTRAEKQVRCRVVIVAASACESARLLLNSRSSRHPDGLANSSGVVGRYLTDTVGYGLSGYVPALAGMPKYDSDGYAGGHLYVPWWELDKKNKDFPRGYHIEIGGGYGMPMVGSFNGVCRSREGYGAPLKKAILDEYGCSVGFAGRGEMIPNAQSFCEIDPNVVDDYGIPVLRFHFQWGDSELRMVKHMHETFSAIIEGMGGTVQGPKQVDTRKAISTPGAIIHELGVVRMGADPRTSALNGWSQAHDCKNLFVADAASFVTNPDKNPTHTICALSWRLSEYAAEEMRKGNL